MKNSIITSLLAVLLASVTTVRAQDYPEEYLGLPGDNLNLYAVMDMFRNSETLEAFERGLNNSESRINNLDLNGDNLVDYITVTDYKNHKVHTIVLRAMLGRLDYQDVAVITVEKLCRKKIRIQLIGDEALYGKNYVIEPVDARSPNPGYANNQTSEENVTYIDNYYYETYEWPVIVYIYEPYYDGWSSSWNWGYYPDYWVPWTPYYWDYYYGYHSGWQPTYYTHYHHRSRPDYRHYDDYYYNGIRQHSPTVSRRVADGNYTQTYSRPDQRREGAALYTSTHGNRTGVTGNDATVNTQGRRAAGSQSTNVQDQAVRNVNRTTPANGATGSRTDAGTGGNRRTSTSTGNKEVVVNPVGETQGETRRTTTSGNNRTEQTNEVDNRETERRSSEAKAAENRAAEVREAQTRAAEAREAQNKATEAREAEAREAQNRAAEAREAEAREAQNRAAEARAAEAREAQNRAAEARAAEAREAQNRAAEVRAAEAREAQNRATEARAAEAREAQNRAAEARAAEAREAQNRAAEARAAEAREAQNRAAEARAAEARETQNRAAEARATQAREADAREAQRKAIEEKAAESRRKEAEQNRGTR